MYRRDFLKTSTTGIALTAISGKLFGCSASSLFGKENINEFGLQLYTLRDVLPNDPKGVLQQVAAMGYKQIESYDHETLGMFWGMKNTDFKKLMDDLDMKIVASHCKINNDFERKADEAAAINMKYLICPSVENEKTMNREGCKKTTDLFNSKGAVCKTKGLRFAYHNHEGPFISRADNLVPQQFFLENTDPALVDFEMDIYWVVTAGLDPIVWLKKYPNRFKLLHVKDRNKNASPSQREAFTMLGKGSINLPEILHTARQNGAEYYLAEQDQCYDTPVMEATRENAAYLKKIRI